MYLISKKFEFDYGHRVWNQVLTQNQICKCRHLHGHTGALTIELRSPELCNDMVLDYNEMGFLKSFVDIYLDHKMILDKHDPLIKELGLKIRRGSNCFGFTTVICGEDLTYNPDWDEENPEDVEAKERMDARLELYRGMTLFDGVPTSENFVKAIYDGVAKRMGEFGVGVNKVSFKETDKTEAVYMRG